MADLWLPRPPPTEPVGVVVLIHGGFWRPQYDRTLMEPLARDVVERAGRRGTSTTGPRAAAAAAGRPPSTTSPRASTRSSRRPTQRGLDLDRVVTVGHSAGGCLSLWAAARAGLPDGAPGAGPKVEPVLAVSQAGVNNLIAGAFEQLGNGAVEALMGEPPKEAGDRYTLASPAERLPIGVDQVVVHGLADEIVPARPEHRSTPARRRRRGDDVDRHHRRGRRPTST